MALRKGTAGVNTLRGTNGIDTLLGLGGNDTLLGLNGKDRLDGGTGRDRMVGGDGNDFYIVDRRDDIIVESKGDGTDTAQSKASFTLPKNVENLTLTGKADIDGTGNALANDIEGNAGENTLSGLGGNDTLIGAGDKDRLLGGDGNDRLEGGTGADRMEGGEGNDTYIFGVGDKVIEGTGNGTDTIRTTVTITSAQVNVEVIRLDGIEAIGATGDGKANRIIGNSGANRLVGGGGGDSLVGGGGNDSLRGGTGLDELDGGPGNDTLAGDDGDDTVIGGAGDDTVNGSAGADILIGGDGNDLIVVDNVGDRAAGGEGISLVPAGIASPARLSAPFAALNGVGDMDEVRSATVDLDLATLVPEDDFEIARLEGDLDLNVIGDPASANRITIIGNAGDNTLIGQNGDDTLDGGAGADSMVGGTGDDTYVVDDVGDVPVEEADEGNDTIVVTNDATLTDFTNFENIAGSGDASLILRGDAGNNTITGAAGDDALFGDDGADVLSGAAGDDQLEGEAGNDSIIGGAGNDRAAFRGDLADYTINIVADTITVTDNNASDGDNGVDAVVTVESLDFSDTTVLAPMALGALDGLNGFKIVGQAAGDFAGRSVHAAGDFNGDGFADLIIGANFNDGAGANAGAAYVVFGKATGFGAVDLDNVAAGIGGFKLDGEAGGDYAGVSVSTAGDVNGDGLADLIVGAFLSDAGAINSGAAYVVFGTNAAMTTLSLGDIDPGVSGFKIIGENFNDVSGTSVALAGDVNGDGLDDVIVGAPGDDTGGNAAGAAYVVFGKAAGFANVNLDNVALGVGGFKIIGEIDGDQVGKSVESAGDVNGDGFDDVIVGAYLEDSGGASGGAAYVVFGKASGFGTVNLDDVAATSTGGFKIVGEAADDRAGRDVSAAGDIDGDGFGDLVIGAYRNSAGGANAGAAYVVFGKDSGFGTVNLDDVAAGVGGFKIIGETGNDFAGGTVAPAGDINGDGLLDLLVGSAQQNAGVVDNGAAYVIFGLGGALATVNLDDIARGVGGLKLFGENAVDLASVSLSVADDVNGDGFDDIIVGADRNDAGGLDAGAAYVIFGRDSTGAVSHLGTADDDILTGDADVNIVFGAQGNDTLDGGADDDKLIGGAGNDLLVFDAADSHRIDGGPGLDILVFAGAGDALDLTAVNVNVRYSLYTGIEIIDLTGSGANSLALDIQDLFHLSDTSNTLRVDGDGDDTITTSDAGWGAGVADADIVGYTSYTNGNATLIVQTDIIQTGVQA